MWQRCNEKSSDGVGFAAFAYANVQLLLLCASACAREGASLQPSSGSHLLSRPPPAPICCPSLFLADSWISSDFIFTDSCHWFCVRYSWVS